MPCLVAKTPKIVLMADTPKTLCLVARAQKMLCLMRVCLNPRGVTYLMQVLLEKRTMKVFRGGASMQVLTAHCLMRVCSNPRGAICSTQVLAVGKRTV